MDNTLVNYGYFTNTTIAKKNDSSHEHDKRISFFVFVS